MARSARPGPPRPPLVRASPPHRPGEPAAGASRATRPGSGGAGPGGKLSDRRGCPAVQLDEQQLLGIGVVEAHHRPVGQSQPVLADRLAHARRPQALQELRLQVALGPRGTLGPALQHPAQRRRAGTSGAGELPSTPSQPGDAGQASSQRVLECPFQDVVDDDAPRSIKVRAGSVQGIPSRSTTSNSARSALRWTRALPERVGGSR